MRVRRFSVRILLPLLAMASAGAGQSAELTGIVTQVQGAVQAVGPGLRGLPRATLWQTLHAGVTVRVPDGGVAGIACSNRRFVRLQGPVSLALTEQACAAGKELTPAEYALIAPQAGRFKVVRGLLVLERDMRAGDEDDSLAPVVMSPRNTVLRLPRPTVSWSRVPSAGAYELRWSGHQIAGYDTALTAENVPCAVDSEGTDVCSAAWPADRPDLPPGETFLLQVAARQRVAGTWHATDPVEVHTQELFETAALESRLLHLESLGLEGVALNTARAGLLADLGLYADAAELYRRVLAVAPSPELRITLADIHLATGLHGLAEARYREALPNEVPAVQAAVAFGLGRLAYAGGHYTEAVTWFQQARGLYAALKLTDEETASGRAAAKAATHVPR
jgi:hypothetical protein